MIVKDTSAKKKNAELHIYTLIKIKVDKDNTPTKSIKSFETAKNIFENKRKVESAGPSICFSFIGLAVSPRHLENIFFSSRFTPILFSTYIKI